MAMCTCNGLLKTPKFAVFPSMSRGVNEMFVEYNLGGGGRWCSVMPFFRDCSGWCVCVGIHKS